VAQEPDRNLALELVRVTEAAALACARWVGFGDKISADRAAVDAMRHMLATVEMDGVVVIGEGEKDEAPMLFNGVVAAAESGTMFDPGPCVYMEKLACGADIDEQLDLDAPIEETLEMVARAKRGRVRDLMVVMLDRPRHEEMVGRIRAAGARIRFISHGDVAGSMMAASPDTGIDLLWGIGGTPEGVLSAAAFKCLGGQLLGRLWPRDEDEAERARAAGYDLSQVLTADDLIKGENVFFAATGVTDGDLLRGVRYQRGGARTHSLVMRSKSGTVRTLQATHSMEKLATIAGERYT
jgi:fructose-1,6-bisphosphatase II